MHAPFFGNGGVKMLKTILLVVYVIICIVLAIVVLSQEGKDASLTSSISGAGGKKCLHISFNICKHRNSY